MNKMRPSRPTAAPIRKPLKSNTCCGACYLTKTQKCVCYSVVVIPILAVTAFALVLAVNALTLQTRFVRSVYEDQPVFTSPSSKEVDDRAARLAEALKIQTISTNTSHVESEAFDRLHEYIVETYPEVHSASYIQKTLVNGHSLLYRVEGTVKTSKPYMLCAHMDVVGPGDPKQWSREPFLGDIVKEGGESYVYGRGALDVKLALFGILEALEHSVKKGIRPKRTFYLAFGHDEEVGGSNGAKHLSSQVKERLDENEESLDFILDEGLFVMKNVVPGVDQEVINIGVVEKGYAVFEMSVVGQQQHSSIPPRHSVVGILAGAVARLEAYQQPSRFGSSVESDMFAYLAPYMNFVYQLVLANLWIFKGLFESLIGRSKTTDALQRTTTAITVLDAGFKVNVIPGKATALINHRVHPVDTLESVLQHDKDSINDWRVTVKVLEYQPPPKVSPYGNNEQAFQVIASAALDVFSMDKVRGSEPVVVPGMLVGNTDTLHYQNLTNKIYRFTPVVLDGEEDINRIHGVDERVSVRGFSQAVEFYHRLMRLSDIFVESKAQQDEISGSGDEEQGVEGSGSGGSEEGETTDNSSSTIAAAPRRQVEVGEDERLLSDEE